MANYFFNIYNKAAQNCSHNKRIVYNDYVIYIMSLFTFTFNLFIRNTDAQQWDVLGVVAGDNDDFIINK